jgi:hypothetical protein
MGTSRKTTESQLVQAKASLSLRVKALQQKGVEAKKFKADPKWRALDAVVRQINSRLRKITEVETVNAELVKLKAENEAKIVAEKAERKSGASKKPKPEKDEGKKAKGEAKAAKKDAKQDKAPKEKKEGSKDKKEGSRK